MLSHYMTLIQMHRNCRLFALKGNTGLVFLSKFFADFTFALKGNTGLVFPSKLFA